MALARLKNEADVGADKCHRQGTSSSWCEISNIIEGCRGRNQDGEDLMARTCLDPRNCGNDSSQADSTDKRIGDAERSGA